MRLPLISKKAFEEIKRDDVMDLDVSLLIEEDDPFVDKEFLEEI